MGFIRGVLRWAWFLIDPKGCLIGTTTKKEREAMGVQLDH